MALLRRRGRVPSAATPVGDDLPTMGQTRKDRVFTALLWAAAVSGLTTLVLILVEAARVHLPAHTKVCPRPREGRLG